MIEGRDAMHRPLADEIRPKTLDEVVGQRHLLAPGGVLRRLIDAGTDNCDSLLEASNFVATIQNRQGFRVSCIEEIAWRKGWIDADQLYRLGEQLGKTEYGTYLMELANSHR